MDSENDPQPSTSFANPPLRHSGTSLIRDGESEPQPSTSFASAPFGNSGPSVNTGENVTISQAFLEAVNDVSKKDINLNAVENYMEQKFGFGNLKSSLSSLKLVTRSNTEYDFYNTTQIETKTSGKNKRVKEKDNTTGKAGMSKLAQSKKLTTVGRNKTKQPVSKSIPKKSATPMKKITKAKQGISKSNIKSTTAKKKITEKKKKKL